MAEFSQRAEQIDRWRAEQVAAFVAAHGRQPTAVEHIRIRQRGTLATRPGKTHHSLAELTEDWRQRADPHVRRERQVAWVTGLKDRNDLPLLRADDLREPILADAAQAVLAEVAERHATFGRMNLLAEAHRILHGVRFASPEDRVAVAERITTLATEAVPVACSTAPPPHPGGLPAGRRLVAATPGKPGRVHHPGVARRRETAARRRENHGRPRGQCRHRGHYHGGGTCPVVPTG